MSYEFAYSPDSHPFSDDEVTIPEYWNPRPERIFQIPPFEPFFVGTGTVVQDKTSHRIGIDCEDKFRDANEDYISEDDSGAMLIEMCDKEGRPVIKGIIVDLRYRKGLYKRDLAFCLPATDERAFELSEYDASMKTQEALALIIFDEQTDELHLRVRPQHRERVVPYALSLMEYVDQVRRERSHDTIDDIAGASEEVGASKLNDSHVGD